MRAPTSERGSSTSSVIAAVLLVLSAVTAGAQCPDGSPPPCRTGRIDTNTFVVLPFRVSGPASAQYLGESMPDLFHSALNGLGRIRVESAPRTRRRLAAIAATDPGAAQEVALELRAGRIIAGNIVAIGSELRLTADVYDAVRRRTLFSLAGRADINGVAAMVDSFATQILVRRLVPAAERRRRTPEYTTKSPEALQAYLVALQLARRLNRRAAADSLKVALRHDSTFGLVYHLLLRLEGSENGSTGLSVARLHDMARPYRHAFPERVRLLIENSDRNYQLDRLAAASLTNTLTDRYPDDADVAFVVADGGFHHGMNLGEPRQNVIRAFERALAFDDYDPELLAHLNVLYIELGDTTRAREYSRRLCQVTGTPTCEEGPDFQIFFQNADVGAALSADTTWGPFLQHYLLRIGASDLPRALALSDTLGKLASHPGRSQILRWRSYIVRADVALARGQYELAWQLLDSASASRNAVIVGLQWVYDIVSGMRAREAAAAVGPPRLLDNPGALAIRAWWSAMRQPADSAAPLLSRLESLSWPDSAFGVAVARGLTGAMVLQRGDTTRARELFRDAHRNHKRRVGSSRHLLPGPWLSLTAARVEAARGDYAAAQLYLADLYPVNDYVPFLAEAEELRGQVALATGDTLSARKHLQTFVAIWDKADPPLQPRVEAARAVLRRIGDR